jgi:hypothetical protein
MMRFASLSVCSGVVLAALCLTQREARAAGSPGGAESAALPSPSSAAGSSWALALGTELAFGMSDARASHASDVVAIESVHLVALDVAARYRVIDALALGARLAWAFELGDRGYATSSGEQGSYDRSLLQLALEGRYQPGGRGWYGAARAGAAAMSDALDGDSVTQWGPLGGLALGYDLRVAGSFALGLELQGTLVGFSEQGASLPGPGEREARYVYGASSWLGLGLVGSLGI